MKNGTLKSMVGKISISSGIQVWMSLVKEEKVAYL